MRDLTIELPNRRGALAEMGEALGKAGVSVDGGGAYLCREEGVGHFLFVNGKAARQVLEEAGIRVIAERNVLVQSLDQSEPGQLGKLSRRMADAGVNIETLYSDHDHQLILVVDDETQGRQVSEIWERERAHKFPGAKLTVTRLHWNGQAATSMAHKTTAATVETSPSTHPENLRSQVQAIRHFAAMPPATTPKNCSWPASLPVTC